ncbi:hypothetical protein MUO79_10535 [Candidatus Bathyarchaeota archaeon]|nr:hypothetical protein [Candidatus Bathyarchaeota archaeon]
MAAGGSFNISQGKDSALTKENILTTLKDSGYPLEQEIASCLEKMEWDFNLNYAFTDIETNISREIDILAQRDLWHESLFKAQQQKVEKESKKGELQTIDQRVRLNVELLIECKRVGSPIVFFCRPKQPRDFFPNHIDDIVHYSGVRPEITIKPLNELSSHIFTIGQLLEFGKISHYSRCSEKATQFCKIFREGKKFKAGHEEIYQSFVVPLIKAIEYQKLVRKVKPTWMYFDMYLHYPLIVIDGEILKVDPKCEILETTNHVELVRNYYSNKIGGTYRIDVISKSYFCDFVEKVLMPSLVSIEKEVRKKEMVIAKSKTHVRTMDKFYRFMHVSIDKK